MTNTATTARKRVVPFFKDHSLFFVLCLIVIIIAIVSPNFRTFSNMLNVGRQISVLAIIALGGTFVIASAGIDLSVGAVLALSGVLMASFMKSTDMVVVAVLLGLGISIFLGFMNGVVIVKANVPPFIATLGMMGIARGISLVFTDGRPITLLPQRFQDLGYASILGVPILVIVTVICFGLALFLFKSTKIGMYTCAIGGNEEAARLSGMNISAYKIGVYALAGLFSGIGAVAYLARVGSAHPTAGNGLELEVITAVIIGGTPMDGGNANIIGTILGAIIVGVLRNGMTILGVSSYWQQVATGFIIILAVGLERYGKRAR